MTAAQRKEGMILQAIECFAPGHPRITLLFACLARRLLGQTNPHSDGNGGSENDVMQRTLLGEETQPEKQPEKQPKFMCLITALLLPPRTI